MPPLSSDFINQYYYLESIFKALDNVQTQPQPSKSFSISDDDYADDDILNQAALTIAEPANENISGRTNPIPPLSPNPNLVLPPPAENPQPNTVDDPMEDETPTLPTPAPPVGVKELENAKNKIKLALEVAKKANNPENHIETALHELDEDTTMMTTFTTEQQLRHQVEAMKFLCNSLIRNAKLAEKMTRIVNTNQITRAVNKSLLMEDLNPRQLSLSQFLQHPFSAEIWSLASHHDSDFEKNRIAWGNWWMGIVEDQAPRQRLRRSVQHARMFNTLATSTFQDFGQNPTRFCTEWLVIQLVRLGDHLLAANLKSEYGFNWPSAYQKTAAYIARNKIVHVAEIFSKIEPLWPSGVRMNFHYNKPAFNDCILQLAETDDNVGKVPEMKKMKHRHDQIFGGPNVADRQNDSDTSVNNEDDRDCENSFSQQPNKPLFPIYKKQKRDPPTDFLSDEDDQWNTLEPRKPSSYADIFK